MSQTARTGESIPVINALLRSRSRWRALAFIAVALVLVALLWRIGSDMGPASGDHIARININGLITTDAARTEMIDRLGQTDSVKGVILAINSPGGTTAGGEELYETLSALRENKPVVTVIGELGASAAYMTAIASDHIIARRLSLVGSVGVLFQHVDASGLLNTIGVDLDKVASGPLKAEPDYDEPLQGEVRQSMQDLVDDSFDWFIQIVSERRGLSDAAVSRISDGRIFNGRVAEQLGLIDEFGGEDAARTWLSGQGVDKDLPIVTQWPRPRQGLDRITDLLGSSARDMLGFDPGGLQALDGLVSLWHAGG